MFEIKIPYIDVSVENIKILEWYNEDGDEINEGEVLVTLESDKATFDIDAEAEGNLKILKNAKDYVRSGDIIGLLYENEKELNNYLKQLEWNKDEIKKSERQNIRITAKAQELIHKNKLNIDDFESNLVLIRESDVYKILKEKQTSGKRVTSLPVRTEKLTSPQVAISRSVLEVQRNTASTFMTITVNATKMIKQIESAVKEKKVLVTSNDAISYLAKEVLKSHPLLNSFSSEDYVNYYEKINLSIAMYTPGGLYTATINDVEGKSLTELSSEIKILQMKAFRNELKLDEITGGTFTITSLTSYDISSFIGILNVHQSGILSIGAIEERFTRTEKHPEGEWAKIINLGLTYDHRIIYGQNAAAFLKDLKTLIESFEFSEQL